MKTFLKNGHLVLDAETSDDIKILSGFWPDNDEEMRTQLFGSEHGYLAGVYGCKALTIGWIPISVPDFHVPEGAD